MNDKTPNYGLNKPRKGSREWDVALNENATVIDAEMKRLKDKDAQQDSRIDNIVAGAGTSNTEIVDARNSAYSGTFANVKTRLDYMEKSALTVGYGVEWDFISDTYKRIGQAAGLNQSSFNSIQPWAGRRRCNLADDGTVNAYFGDAGYTEDGSNGQVMVEQPEFWYRREFTDRSLREFISPVPAMGFQKIEKYYAPAYEGSIYDVSAGAYLLNDEQVADFTAGTGDKLSSIAGAKPASGLTQNLTIANARQLAKNRGAGWGQLDFYAATAEQALMLVEYATLNMQAAIGLGVVNKATGTGNESEVTGQTSSLGNASGMAPGTNGLVSVSYRGVENFWGNIWSFVDGLNINNNEPFIATDAFVSDKFTDNYKSDGRKMPAANGYQSKFLEIAFGYLPDGVTGSTSTKVTDYYYQSTGARVALLGGSWGGSLIAGARCWLLGYAASSRDRSIGARLLFRPKKQEEITF